VHAILHKMLPERIVEQLKEGRRAKGKLFRDVTLLFMDIEGFTRLSASTTPPRVVKLLNNLFSEYDRLTDRLGVFKVQTIGDAYVACTGLPYVDASVDVSADKNSERERLQRSASASAMRAVESDNKKTEGYTRSELERVFHALRGHVSVRRARMMMQPSLRDASSRKSFLGSTAIPASEKSAKDHALTMIELAAQMHEATKKIKHPSTGESIRVRIGIHTGTIVGGVIGTSTLRFDIWGPHVTAGNMMESHGVPGKTVVSETTRLVLGDESP